MKRPIPFSGLRPKSSKRSRGEDEVSRAQKRMEELLRRAEQDRKEQSPVVPLSAASELDIAFAPPEDPWAGSGNESGKGQDSDRDRELGREWARASKAPDDGSADYWPDPFADYSDHGARPSEAPAPPIKVSLSEPLAAEGFEQEIDGRWLEEELLSEGLSSEGPLSETSEATWDQAAMRPSVSTDSPMPLELLSDPLAEELVEPAVVRQDASSPDGAASASKGTKKATPRPKLLRGRRVGVGHEAEGRTHKGIQNVLPFRRRSRDRRVRRLRRHPVVRWLGPLAVALMIMAVPLSILGWFLASPSFALTHISVQEDELGRVDGDWVLRALGGFHGANIWLLPLDRVETALKRHPWVGDVALRKLPPNDLAVRIVERREAALYRSDKGLVYVDASGETIAPWRSVQGMGDLPILSGRGDAEHLAGAVALVEEVYKAGPTWAEGLSEVEILSELDYRLYTRDLPFPLLVRAGTVDSKAHHLQTILPRILDRFETVAAVDLRFARRIIIEPVAQDPRRS